jgi:hypothetical protein
MERWIIRGSRACGKSGSRTGRFSDQFPMLESQDNVPSSFIIHHSAFIIFFGLILKYAHDTNPEYA